MAKETAYMAVNKKTGREYGPYSKDEREAFLSNPSTKNHFTFRTVKVEKREPAPEPKAAKRAKKSEANDNDK